MVVVQLEEGLKAYRCPETGGHYIPAVAYMRWLSGLPARTPQLPAAADPALTLEPPSESPAYCCPETATLMIRYKVGHGFKFSIDRSITGGIWLDQGEWESLRSRNFHDEIHLMFTTPWQREALREEVSASRRTRLEERIGSELLGHLDSLKSTLENHPHRDEIIAYLIHS